MEHSDLFEYIECMHLQNFLLTAMCGWYQNQPRRWVPINTNIAYRGKRYTLHLNFDSDENRYGCINQF